MLLTGLYPLVNPILLWVQLLNRFSRYIYPKEYRFSKEDFDVYKDAVKLGTISGCQPFDKVDCLLLSNLTLEDARNEIGIESSFLQAYYLIEKKRYPNSPESQRLV